jgi:hypothetical protein
MYERRKRAGRGATHRTATQQHTAQSARRHRAHNALTHRRSSKKTHQHWQRQVVQTTWLDVNAVAHSFSYSKDARTVNKKSRSSFAKKAHIVYFAATNTIKQSSYMYI